MKKGKFAEAISAYTRAISQCPLVVGVVKDADNDASFEASSEVKAELAKVYQNRAFAHEQSGSHSQALADSEEAVRLDPTYVRAWSRRSKAREATQDLRGSLEDATAVCMLENFTKEESLRVVDRLLKTIGQREAQAKFQNRSPVTPSPQFFRTYFAAFRRDPLFPMENDDKDAASSRFSPSSSSSPFLRALQCMKELRDLDSVIDLCGQELANSSSDFLREARLLRGTFFMLRGSGDEARADFDALLAEVKDADDDSRYDVTLRVNALIKRGTLSLRRNDEVAAMADLVAAEALDAHNSDVFYHRAQLHLMMDRKWEACADYRRCAELAPDFAVGRVQSVYAEYGFRRARLKAGGEGDTTSLINKTRESFDALLEEFPHCAEGWALYGQIMVDERQYEEADRLFLRALEVN